MSAVEEKCENCRFSRTYRVPPLEREEEWFFECRLNPPVSVALNELAVFPKVRSEDWCGQYQEGDNATRT